jgi:hypothetical protein
MLMAQAFHESLTAEWVSFRWWSLRPCLLYAFWAQDIAQKLILDSDSGAHTSEDEAISHPESDSEREEGDRTETGCTE